MGPAENNAAGRRQLSSDRDDFPRARILNGHGTHANEGIKGGVEPLPKRFVRTNLQGKVEYVRLMSAGSQRPSEIGDANWKIRRDRTSIVWRTNKKYLHASVSFRHDPEVTPNRRRFLRPQ